jgi:hypothetical protein
LQIIHMNIEQRILCLAARTSIAPDDERSLLELLHGPVDWEHLWAQGHLHEVLPLLVTTLRHLENQFVVPAAWMARAQRRLYATMVRNTTMADELVRVLRAFRQAGVDGIPVKGLVLADTLYGGLALRSLGDLDVLIRPNALPVAREVLAMLGFAPAPEPGFENAYHPFHDPPYYRATAAGQICLELHWGLWARRFFHLDAEPLWSRVVAARLHGIDVHILSPEDTLLHLAIHRSSSALRLRFVCDIAELLRRNHATLDWTYVLAQARVAGARTALFSCLTLAQDLLGAPLPEHILPSLAVGRLKRRILDHTCGSSALFRLSAADDLSQQPSVVLRIFEQDGLGHIVWAIGTNVARKSQKWLYNFGFLRKAHQ